MTSVQGFERVVAALELEVELLRGRLSDGDKRELGLHRALRKETEARERDRAALYAIGTDCANLHRGDHLRRRWTDARCSRSGRCVVRSVHRPGGPQ